MKFNERLWTLRQKLNLKQSDVAKKLGVSQQNISRYEKGRVEPSYTFVSNLILTFGINPSWLFNEEGEMFTEGDSSGDSVGLRLSRVRQYLEKSGESRGNYFTLEDLRKRGINLNWVLTGEGEMFSKNNFLELSGVEFASIPVFGEISCGSPYEIHELPAEDFVLVDTRQLPGNVKDYAALKAKGRSMYPEIKEGDTVIIRLSGDWSLTQNRICAVKIEGETTLKKVLLNSDGGNITLFPYNMEYTPLIIPKEHLEEVMLIGYAVMVIRDFRKASESFAL